MKHPAPLQILQQAAASYQEAHVIHRCATCADPCCGLQTHVLELNWKQVKVFWHLDTSRAAFDAQLAAGNGPKEIRAGNGLYYVHQKSCPAYDLTQRTCRVYDQPIKPTGCTDYPVYCDGDRLVADLRCEAVNIDALVAWVARTLPPGLRIVQTADKDFPFLVSISVRPAVPGRKARKPRIRAG